MNSISDILGTTPVSQPHTDSPLTNSDTDTAIQYGTDNTLEPTNTGTGKGTHAAESALPQSLVSSQPIDISAIRTALRTLESDVQSILRLLDGQAVTARHAHEPDIHHAPGGERVVEGVFTGEKMQGADGNEYAVPENYASKSKLVEGDLMKLTITANGSFIYKQIGPTERDRVKGELVQDEEHGGWSARTEAGRVYRVLTASVRFFKGHSGSTVVLLIPQDGESEWGAIENML